MKNLYKSLVFLIVCFLYTETYAQNYSISNVSLINTGSSLAIKYDLNSANLNDIFEVNVKIYGQNGTEFKAVTLTGALGKNLTAGTAKLIHWFAHKDGFLIDEDVFVDIIVLKQNYDVPLTSHLIKSALIPGWGDYRLDNGKFYFLKGIIGYGLIGTSIYFNQQAYDNRQGYLNSMQTAERNNLYDRYNQQKTVSYVVAGVAIAWWAYDLYKVIHKRNKLSKDISPQNSRFYFEKSQNNIIARSNSYKFDTYTPYDKQNKIADDLFALKDYENAKISYTKALDLKPYEAYPQQKINEINKIIDAIALKEANYKANIQKGDSLFAKEDYENAKSAFEIALTYKPDDLYAKNRKDEAESEIIRIPILKIDQGSLIYTDGSIENNALDALETSTLKFKLSNKGKMDAEGVIVRVTEKNFVQGINYDKIIDIGKIGKGATKEVKIILQGQFEIQQSKANFQIKVDEANGFVMKPFEIEIPTIAFAEPKLLIVEKSVSSSNGNITKNEPLDLIVLMQNTGTGNAENINVQLKVDDGVYLGSNNENTAFDFIPSGESKKIKYKLYVTNKFEGNSIHFNFIITEKYKKFGSQKSIEIALNEKIDDTPKTILVAKVINPTSISLASLSSMVDKNIPINPSKNNQKFALIIGNEDYQKHQPNLNFENNVEFAKNDAKTFSEYAIKTLGIPEENTTVVYDATAATMNQKIELFCKRLKYSGKESELIFYYAGHGLPDETTKIPYLIPVDVSGDNLTAAIKLDDVYKKFTETGIAKITVFLDACFSGGARNQSLIATRGIKVKPNEKFLNGKLVVFAATSGQQAAHPFPKEQHGLFTFYVLKKFQESAGNITYKELSDYLKKIVAMEALRIKEVEQEPHVIVSPDAENIWENWKF